MMFTNKVLTITGFLLLIYINSINAQGACLTPSQQVGQCILLRNCTVLYNIILQSGGQLTPEQRTLISGSWCGTENNQHKVCCPRSTPTPTLTSTNTAVSLTPTDYTNHPNARIFDLRTCGNIVHDKIFKGNKTEPFQFVWMAILQYKNLNNDIEQNCGGSLITRRFVLTAAHCITLLRGDITLHSVVLGEHNTKTDPDCISPDECTPPIQIILVDRSIPHPAYDKRLFTNDVGLVRLQSLAELNDAVHPICLPITLESQREPLPYVIVTGWGKTENGSSSDELLQARVETITNDVCNQRYTARYRGRVTVSAIHLCAGGEESDSCQGDSGGPAMTQVATRYGPRSVQFGIVSAGASQCGINYGVPGLYARVAPYVKWILDTCNE